MSTHDGPSVPPPDRDDPRWLAYLLGELTDAERAEVEAMLARSPEARAHLEEVREVVGALERELGGVPAPALGESGRGAIRQAAARPRRGRRGVAILVACSVAVPMAAGVAFFVAYSGTKQRAAELKSVSNSEDFVNNYYRSGPQGGSPVTRGSRPEGGHVPLGDPLTRGGDFSGAIKSSPDGAPVDMPPAGAGPGPGRDVYAPIADNPFVAVADDPRSTFSIDVDTASYANVRRFLRDGRMPPADAVRIEELVNYFRYDYPAPAAGRPFSVSVETSAAPWAQGHLLAKIGLRGRDVALGQRPPANLVFLIDVSGSMADEDRLPLLRQALLMLARRLGDRDRVAIVVYAGASGLVLPSTPGDRRAEIEAAVARLEAGGGTNGGAGIRLAYRVAREHFVKGGINRVILATDGDFNVGVTSRDELVRLIQEEAGTGVFLTVLGVGRGNLADATLEQLADQGNGHYAYLDNLDEAHRVLVEEMSGTLMTIAKDVKIQIELNPAEVSRFRLIGYENRVLAHRDFADDKKDAGDIGAGHTVTALYELVPAAAPAPGAGAPDPLRYQDRGALRPEAASGELFTVKLRYKTPESSESALVEVPVRRDDRTLAEASADFRFAAGVAAFGMLLRDSPHKGDATWGGALRLALSGVGADPDGRRAELVELIRRAKELSERPGVGDVRPPPPERAVFTGGEPQVGEGSGLTPEQVLRVVMMHRPAIQRCFDKELLRFPNLSGGLVVSWRIDAGGKVLTTRVEISTLGNADVESCLARQIGKWRFPVADSGRATIVNFPFLFRKR